MDNPASDVFERQLRARIRWAVRTLGENPVPELEESNLPWRRWRTPYRVFIAEFLLVRTRADVVARIFENVIAQYPDVCTLANASEVEIEKTLAPLGLNKRVPLLRRAAQHIIAKHQGQIPESLEELMAIPGLGLYSAPAIMAFAFDSATVPADVNILRFVSRVTGLAMMHKTKGSAVLRSLLPLLSGNRRNPTVEYLLDFTRLVCRPRKPTCGLCPLTKRCDYFVSEVRRG